MDVVVIGGNFSGLSVAFGIKKRYKDVNVTLIDKNKYSEFYPGMHEIISNLQTADDVRINLQNACAKNGVLYLNKEVTALDLKNKKIIAKEKKLGYDYLVIAVGCINNFFGISGADKYAVPFKLVDHAVEIKRRLDELNNKFDMYSVIVAGSGLTGIELVFEIKRYLDINASGKETMLYLLEGAPVVTPWSNKKAQRHIQHLLNREGIITKTNFLVNNVKKNSVISKDKKEVTFDLLIWCTGLKTAPLIENSKEVEHLNNGAIVDDYLRVIGYDNVFVAGDAICKEEHDENPTRKNAHNALLEADIIVKNIIASSFNKKLKKFVPNNHSPTLIALGRYGAIFTYKKLTLKRPAKFFRYLKKLIQRAWFKSKM